MTDIRQSRTERKHPDVQYIVTSTEYHQGVVSPRDTLSPSDQNHEMFRRDGTSDPTFFDKNMTIVNIDGAQKSGRDSPELNPHRKSTGGSSQPVQQPESPVSGSSHTEPVRNHVATDEDMENLTRSANTFVRTNPLETTKTPKAGTLKVLRPFTPSVREDLLHRISVVRKLLIPARRREWLALIYLLIAKTRSRANTVVTKGRRKDSSAKFLACVRRKRICLATMIQ